MGSLFNVISEQNSRFFSTSGDWSVTGATSRVDIENVFDRRWGSLRLTPADTSTSVVVSLVDIPTLLNQQSDTLQFHVRLKAAASLDVAVVLGTSNGEISQRSTRTQTADWTACRGNKVYLATTGSPITASVDITIDDHEGEDIFLTIPFMYYSYIFTRDRFLVSVMDNIPDFIFELDQTHEELHDLPDFPLTRIAELTTGYGGKVVRDFYDFEYLDISSGKNTSDTSTLSELVDPLAVRDAYIPWLSQFSGVTLDNPPQGFTPWKNLPTTWAEFQQIIDPAGNPTFTPTSIVRSSNVVTATIGSHSLTAGMWLSLTGSTSSGQSFDGSYEITGVGATTITWDQAGPNESATGMGTIIVSDTEWGEAEEYDPGLEDVTANNRWQIQTGYNGINAGTTKALRESVAQPLTGDKIVTITYRYNGNPWEILVRTKTDETPGGEEGSSAESVEIYIAKAKPAGFKVTHECTSTGS